MPLRKRQTYPPDGGACRAGGLGAVFGEPVARDKRLEVVDFAAMHAVDENLRRQNNGEDVLILCRIAVQTPRMSGVHCAVHDGNLLRCPS
jgi:hypothetical protein